MAENWEILIRVRVWNLGIRTMTCLETIPRKP
jgi:hypothetical protein